MCKNNTKGFKNVHSLLLVLYKEKLGNNMSNRAHDAYFEFLIDN